QELPRDRVELYREASRVLLHEWDASKAFPVDNSSAVHRHSSRETPVTEIGRVNSQRPAAPARAAPPFISQKRTWGQCPIAERISPSHLSKARSRLIW